MPEVVGAGDKTFFVTFQQIPIHNDTTGLVSVRAARTINSLSGFTRNTSSSVYEVRTY